MALEIPADIRARAAAVGIQIGFKYVANFAYLAQGPDAIPEAELVTTMQAPWDSYPDPVHDINHVLTAIHIGEEFAATAFFL